VAPPHLAFIFKRTLFEEYSEHFIWKIKYMNEKLVFKKDGEGVAKAERIRQALLRREIPLVLANKQLKLEIEPISQALQQAYQEVTVMQALNTPIWVMVPRDE